MAIKAVCFDLGGVLVEINHFWMDAIESAGVTPQIMPSPELRLGDLAALDEYHDGAISWEEYLSDLRDHFGLSGDKDAAAVHDAILIGPMRGAYALVDALNRAGLTTGCLSNTNARHWERLSSPEAFAAISLLKSHVASHAAKVSKPELAIYELYEKTCGFKGDEIVFFDDSPVNVAAARKLGWQSVWIQPNRPSVEQIHEFLAVHTEIGPIGLAANAR